jgi:hypothetical protein
VAGPPNRSEGSAVTLPPRCRRVIAMVRARPAAPDPERAAAQYVERVRRALDYGETILSKK